MSIQTVSSRQPESLKASFRQDKGSALLSTVLIMMLVSAMLVGFFALVMADQRTGQSNRDQTTAYAAAHAGLEQLTAKLGELFATNYRPTSAQVNDLMSTPPSLGDGITYSAPGGAEGSGYRITFTDTNNDGFPDPETEPRDISSGAYQGLKGTVTPYTIEVTARTDNGAEVRMRRQMQTVLIPAFQFGIYSENDLSFFAGPQFDFGGRVHTNNNLYLAEGDGNSLLLRDRITAVGEVVRTNLSNGYLTSSNYQGTVLIAKTGVGENETMTSSGAGANSVSMARSAGSWSATEPQYPPAPVPGVTPDPGTNSGWRTFSTTTTNGFIKNARTGAKPLVLPLVQMGAQPIDLIRRPVTGSNEDVTNEAVYEQRYYSRASLRILISDTAADITGLPGFDPNRPGSMTDTAPIDLSTLRPITKGGPNPTPTWYPVSDIFATTPTTGGFPIAMMPPHPTKCITGTSGTTYSTCSGVPGAGEYWATDGQWSTTDTPLISGFLKIELKKTNNTWVDVTTDILRLGFTGKRLSNTNPGTGGGSFTAINYYLNNAVFNVAPSAGTNPSCTDPNPDAVIRLQRVREDHNPLNATTCGVAASGQRSPYDVIPLALFDPREGNLRDNVSTTSTDVPLGGVMHYVELDIRNLARWFAGTIGAGGFGPLAEFSDGGYVVYFSDRRTNARVSGYETGEYGFEDMVNPASVSTLPNGILDGGEDVNGCAWQVVSGVFKCDEAATNHLETYGQVPNAGVLATFRTSAPLTASTRPWNTVNARQARLNRPIFFRRALKLVNAAGTATNSSISPLTVLPTGRGLTIVSENPTYIQGNYNTGTSPSSFGSAQTDHRPSAVIADAVTLLSVNWNDLRSFAHPQNPGDRAGATTWYRLAVVSGKGLSFTRPTWAAQDFGTDGGAHNFLRFIEGWSGTLNYRGSIVSFYTSRQAVGTYKCCVNVYDPPTRGYKFDTEFLQLSLLPPKSPAFRDVNTLTFRQVLRPTQQ